MSSYAPSWVRRDERRFPRAELPDQRGEEILSAFSPQVLGADSSAFRALMAHLRQTDSTAHTVVMVQVENEIGMLPTARDHSPEGNRAYAGPVPAALIAYLQAHRAGLVASLRQRWEANGARSSGTWEQLFGAGPATAEIFTAWYYARYADAVARSGKAAYDLPMYANVALNRPGKAPGDYPSGGPLPHLIDVWKAGAPSLDLLAPDVYFPNFSEIVAEYDRPDNALFIPEQGRASMAELMANAFFAVGEHKAIGFSPFSVDTFGPEQSAEVRQAYEVLNALSPMIERARAEDRVRSVKPPVSFDGAVDERPQQVELGGYRFTVGFVVPFTAGGQQQPREHVAMIVQTGPEEYWIAGRGAVLTFEPLGAGPPIAGIDTAWEEVVERGKLVQRRLLNGDETHQGRHIRLPPDQFSVQRVTLYRYR